MPTLSNVPLNTTQDPNRGRSIQFVSGIQGISAGANATINHPTDRRYHRMKHLTQCINYTGGTGLTTTKITGGGANNLTVTPTVVNGVITAVAVVAGGTGYTTGDTITINDATGTGFVGTVTAAAGVVTAVAVTSTGTASPVSPITFFTNNLRLTVGGTSIRDISADSLQRIACFSGEFPLLGELPWNFTEPRRNLLQANDTTSWDMVKKPQFDSLFSISSLISLPALTSSMEFDTLRNAFVSGKQNVLFDNPIWQKEQNVNVSAGTFDVTTLTFNGALQRLYLLGATPGNITRLEVYQDNNKRMEATAADIAKHYFQYGLQLGQPNYINQTYATSNALKAAYNPPIYFDTAYCPDVDSRLSDKLYARSLVVRVFSNIAQSVRFVIESAPGQFK